MKAKLREAELAAGVKSSRLLRKLLKYASATKSLTRAEIVGLANLYRCVNKDTGSVLWISGDDDATELAEKAGYLKPKFQAVTSDVSDADEEGEAGEDEHVGDGDHSTLESNAPDELVSVEEEVGGPNAKVLSMAAGSEALSEPSVARSCVLL